MSSTEKLVFTELIYQDDYDVLIFWFATGDVDDVVEANETWNGIAGEAEPPGHAIPLFTGSTYQLTKYGSIFPGYTVGTMEPSIAFEYVVNRRIAMFSLYTMAGTAPVYFETELDDVRRLVTDAGGSFTKL